jgi:hypothetical protein
MAFAHGWQLVLAVGRRPSFLTIWNSPEGCLSVLTAWQLLSLSKCSKREPGRSCGVCCCFNDLASKVMYHHFHDILLIMQVIPVWCGRELYWGMNTRMWGPQGTILKAGYFDIPFSTIKSCLWNAIDGNDRLWIGSRRLNSILMVRKDRKYEATIYLCFLISNHYEHH